MTLIVKIVFTFISLTTSVHAYWLMGVDNFITTERIDPIVNPGNVSGYAHSVLGASNFGFNINTAKLLKSECTSIPIPQDKSNYWFPPLYFQWANGSFSSVNGAAVIYYLFDDKPGSTTAFPPDFRMISGNPLLRVYDSNSHSQQAIDFLCLDSDGQTTKYSSLPKQSCSGGIRSQINFPSCWDGKNVDSPDHKSHVAFKSGGPDSGTCSDPKFPVTIPRIFLEVNWESSHFDEVKSQAMNPEQPFVFAYGDPTGYGNHANFYNGWEPGVLQRAVDGCTCNIYGDPTCCVEKGIFSMTKGNNCYINKSIDERTTGTIPELPGNSSVQSEGKPATMYPDANTPGVITPGYVYHGNPPASTGKDVSSFSTASLGGASLPVKPSVVGAMIPLTYGDPPIANPSPMSPPPTKISPPASIGACGGYVSKKTKRNHRRLRYDLDGDMYYGCYAA